MSTREENMIIDKLESVYRFLLCTHDVAFFRLCMAALIPCALSSEFCSIWMLFLYLLSVLTIRARQKGWASPQQTPRCPILRNREFPVHYNYGENTGEWKVVKRSDWTCPCCNAIVGERYHTSSGESHNQKMCKFCPECGQKLKWTKPERKVRP